MHRTANSLRSLSLALGAYALALALASVPGTASATLTATDLATSGDGLLTLDSTSGLEWLDAPLTKGLSANGALAAYTGFRIPTQSELASFLTGAGLTNLGNGAFIAADLAAGNSLVALLGATNESFGGLILDLDARYYSDDFSRLNVLQLGVRNPPAGSPGTSTFLTTLSPTPPCLNCSNSDWAVFLVRDATAIPTPSGAILLAGAAAFLAWRRRAA